MTLAQQATSLWTVSSHFNKRVKLSKAAAERALKTLERSEHECIRKRAYGIRFKVTKPFKIYEGGLPSDCEDMQ